MKALYLIMIFIGVGHTATAQDCLQDWGIRNCPAGGLIPCVSPVSGHCFGQQEQWTNGSGNFLAAGNGANAYYVDVDFPVICTVVADCVPEHDLNGNVVGCGPDLLSTATNDEFTGGYVNYDLPCLNEENPEEPVPEIGPIP